MTTLMLALMLIASGADLVSTEYAISSGYAAEGNPLMRSRQVRLAQAIGVPVAAYFLTRGKPRVAKWVCIVHVGIHSAATAWNVSVIVRW
jgi:hypothetical protein